MWDCLCAIKSIPWEDIMSATGIPNANPVTPASWAPAQQQGAPPPSLDHHRDKDATAAAPSHAAKPSSHHKVDVRA